MNITNEKLAYNLVELHYIKLMKDKEEFSKMNEYQLWNVIFPMNWHSSSDLKKKAEFLNKAIETKTCLMNIKGISCFDEGIKFSKPNEKTSN